MLDALPNEANDASDSKVIFAAVMRLARPLMGHFAEDPSMPSHDPVGARIGVPTQAAVADAPPVQLKPLFLLAWALCAVFYFFQYAVRSAPGVMQHELSAAWGGNHIGGMISAYYVAYALMALIAGVLLDRYRCSPAARCDRGIGSVRAMSGMPAWNTVSKQAICARPG